ncbi:hypothetical protein [Pseudarthrobacter sp. BIM B-2242]|uniref:hypothetical protein n=1 Tax=Pseudarthrobacter sp. BIM B-2242 TaxID=2772401 RepID=UPI00168A7816|nr:hypothetical protein [Pseudarthrobacter sp. BIM B-2242]QOD05999.1 hypothetical protein IDT60_20755 [Pseudarthrobacter sp. BIM B-2242]
MDEKVFLAAATTNVSLTAEQLEALDEHGWKAVHNPEEDSPGSLLLRQVQSEDDAVVQFADLIQDVRLSHLLGIATTPYLENPLQASDQRPSPIQATAYLDDPLNADATIGKSSNSAKSGDPATKSPKTPEDPPKEAAQKAEPFPAIPEYLWKTLKPDNQDELAKKLVEYAINRADIAAYGSGFDDAALFAHLELSERSGLAKKVIEQKHGMAAEQVKREDLVNEFQTERVNLMKSAVLTAGEVNLHLAKWRELSGNVWPLLRVSSIIAGVFVLVSFALVFVGRISGWELAVLAFVFALMAVSPATLLLIGRPLKGLDEWSPSKQEKKADEAAKDEPAKDKAKPEK